jgi:hypothetical protein
LDNNEIDPKVLRMIIKKLGVVEKLSSGSDQGQVVDSCGHVNEYSSSIIFKYSQT